MRVTGIGVRAAAVSAAAMMSAGLLTVAPAQATLAGVSAGEPAASTADAAARKRWVSYTVWPGAYCDCPGWYGHTRTGTVMKCYRKAGEDRPRWRRP